MYVLLYMVKYLGLFIMLRQVQYIIQQLGLFRVFKTRKRAHIISARRVQWLIS